jgi:AcrR family transcriptional regulator
MLFKKRGYYNSSLKEIAKKSGVSIPTIYNYFDSKSDLLLSIAAESVEELDRDLDALIENPPNDPVQAITKWIALCVEGSLEALERELWSAIWLVELQTNNHQQLTQNLKNFYVGKHNLFLKAMQERGQLATTVDIETASKLFDTIGLHFHRKIVIEGDETRQSYKRELKRFVKQILTGLATQGEVAS